MATLDDAAMEAILNELDADDAAYAASLNTAATKSPETISPSSTPPSHSAPPPTTDVPSENEEEYDCNTAEAINAVLMSLASQVQDPIPVPSPVPPSVAVPVSQSSPNPKPLPVPPSANSRSTSPRTPVAGNKAEVTTSPRLSPSPAPSPASPPSESVSMTLLNPSEVQDHRVVRRCSVKIGEARGLPKGFIASYVEVYSDNRPLQATTLKENTQTPFWGEELELALRPHEKTLSFRLFGLETKKSRKDLIKSSVGLNRDSKAKLNTTAAAAPKGFSAPKLIGEVVLDFMEINENTSKENWYPLSFGKGKAKDRKVVEGCDMRFSLKYEETLVLPASKYDALIKILFDDPSFEVLTVLGRVEEVTPKHRNEIAEHLVHIAEAKKIAPPLLSHLVKDEIARTPSRQVLFRGNSIVTKAVDYYQKLVGTDWLVKVQPLIDKIFLDDEQSCEVVQSKLNSDDDLEKHVSLLVGHVDFAFTYVNTFKELCPASLREIYHALFEAALKRFPDDADAKFTAVSGFLFLRYFVPALLTPKLFGLSESYAEGSASRTFTLIATVLQKLGNLQEFEPREAHLDRLNPWLKQHLPAFKALIEFVSNDANKGPPNIAVEDLDISAHLASLHRLINIYLPHLEKDPSAKVKEFLAVIDQLKPEFANAQNIIATIKHKAMQEEQAAEEQRRHGSQPKPNAPSEDKPTLDKDFLFGPRKGFLASLKRKASVRRSRDGSESSEEDAESVIAKDDPLRASSEPAYVGPKWKCPQCSWQNPLPKDKCGMCGHVRPDNIDDAAELETDGSVADSDGSKTPKKPSQPVFDLAEAYLKAKENADRLAAETERQRAATVVKAAKWKCPKCTVENETGVAACQMCGHKRDSLTPQGPSPRASPRSRAGSSTESPLRARPLTISGNGAHTTGNSSGNASPESSFGGGSTSAPPKQMEFPPGAQIGDPPGLIRSKSGAKSRQPPDAIQMRKSAPSVSILKPSSDPDSAASATTLTASAPSPAASFASGPQARPTNTDSALMIGGVRGKPATTASTEPTPLTAAQIQARAQQMLAQGIDKNVVAAFVKQQKALLDASTSSDASPASSPSRPALATSSAPTTPPVTITTTPPPASTTLTASPYSRPHSSNPTTPTSLSVPAFAPFPVPAIVTSPVPSVSPSGIAPMMATPVPPLISSMVLPAVPTMVPGMMPAPVAPMKSVPPPMTSEQIQAKAMEMLAQGVDKGIVANFIIAQQAIQLQAQQAQAVYEPIRIQYTGRYVPKSPSDLFICYDCRYEIAAQESALNVADRYYHAACFLCGRCKKDITKLDFFCVTDQQYCPDCYRAYAGL